MLPGSEGLNLERCSRQGPAAAESDQNPGFVQQKLERRRRVQSPGQGVPDPCSKTLIPELATFVLALQFCKPAQSGRPGDGGGGSCLGKGSQYHQHSDAVPGRCCCPCCCPCASRGTAAPAPLPGQLGRTEERGDPSAVPKPQEQGAASRAETVLG